MAVRRFWDSALNPFGCVSALDRHQGEQGLADQGESVKRTNEGTNLMIPNHLLVGEMKL